MRAASSVCVLLVLGLSSGQGATAEHWKAVRGAVLRSLFAGKEFGDGVHFAYRFRTDGTFAGTEMSRSVTGKWRKTDREMCWEWTRPPGAEECYTVEVDGTAVRLMRNDAEAWFGRVGK